MVGEFTFMFFILGIDSFECDTKVGVGVMENSSMVTWITYGLKCGKLKWQYPKKILEPIWRGGIVKINYNLTTEFKVLYVWGHRGIKKAKFFTSKCQQWLSGSHEFIKSSMSHLIKWECELWYAFLVMINATNTGMIHF